LISENVQNSPNSVQMEERVSFRLHVTLLMRKSVDWTTTVGPPSEHLFFRTDLTLSAGPQKSPYLILLGNYSCACHDDESTIVKACPQASAALVFFH